MPIQASGTAITKATITNKIKSLEIMVTIFEIDAPNTFRTPISLVRCVVV